MTARNIHYEIAERTRGIAHGGIGAIHALARRIGLIDTIDANLHLLQFPMPYHESDHVLNFAYNALCDGDCLQDIDPRKGKAVPYGVYDLSHNEAWVSVGVSSDT